MNEQELINYNKEVQRKLVYLLAEDLITMTKLASDLKINYTNVSKFRTGTMNYSENYLNRINEYLDLWLEFEYKLDMKIKELN